MIGAAWRRDEDHPAFGFGQHRPQEGFCFRISERPFGEDDPGWRRADEAIVVVRTDEAPCRPVRKPYHHVVIAGPIAQFGRKRLINAPYSRMRRDRIPDRFAGLGLLRKHVPVIADPTLRGYSGPIQGDIVPPAADKRAASSRSEAA